MVVGDHEEREWRRQRRHDDGSTEPFVNARVL